MIISSGSRELLPVCRVQCVRLPLLNSRRLDMRSFILACVAVAVIATTSAAVLSYFQESADAAFSTEAVRL
jgi:hypothetical protein